LYLEARKTMHGKNSASSYRTIGIKRRRCHFENDASRTPTSWEGQLFDADLAFRTKLIARIFSVKITESSPRSQCVTTRLCKSV
jgi:hypothetical protein